jgi:hypothetical protein
LAYSCLKFKNVIKNLACKDIFFPDKNNLQQTVFCPFLLKWSAKVLIFKYPQEKKMKKTWKFHKKRTERFCDESGAKRERL